DGDRDLAGTRRFAADIEHVCAFTHHAQPLRYRGADVGPEAVAAERVGRHVYDAHHIRARAPLETPAADFGKHEPIILRHEMRLVDIARGAGAVLRCQPDVQMTGIVRDAG